MSGNLTRLSAARAPGCRSSNREFRAPPFRGEDEGPDNQCDIAEEEPKLVTLRRSADRSQPTIWAGRNK
jgi:hypothetical protein